MIGGIVKTVPYGNLAPQDSRKERSVPSLQQTFLLVRPPVASKAGARDQPFATSESSGRLEVEPAIGKRRPAYEKRQAKPAVGEIPRLCSPPSAPGGARDLRCRHDGSSGRVRQ